MGKMEDNVIMSMLAITRAIEGSHDNSQITDLLVNI
jgi:hypothetical protein